jgi:hypothetical protein
MEGSISVYPFRRIVDDEHRRMERGGDKCPVFDLMIDNDGDPLFP